MLFCDGPLGLLCNLEKLMVVSDSATVIKRSNMHAIMLAVLSPESQSHKFGIFAVRFCSVFCSVLGGGGVFPKSETHFSSQVVYTDLQIWGNFFSFFLFFWWTRP